MGLDKFKTEKGKITKQHTSNKFIMSKDMKEPSPEKAYIVGVILGDGSVFKSYTAKRISLTSIDKEFVEEFSKVFCKWANLEWSGINSENTDLSINNTESDTGNKIWIVTKGIADGYEHLLQYQKVKAYNILKLSKEFKFYKEDLLRGLWDSEGSIHSERGRVSFSSSNEDILMLYMSLLSDVIDIKFNKDWKWASNKEIGRHYGDFRMTGSSKGTKDIILPNKYRKQFFINVNPTIERKRKIFKQYI